MSKLTKPVVLCIMIVLLFSPVVAGGDDSTDTILLPSIEMASLRHLILRFSEPVDKLSAIGRTAYYLSTVGNPTSVVVAEDHLSVTLTFSQNMSLVRDYVLTIQGVQQVETQTIEFEAVETININSFLEEKIAERNPTARMNANTLAIFRSGQRGLTEGRDALFDAYAQLDDQIRSLPALELPYEEPLSDAQERVNQAVEGAYNEFKRSLENNRTAIVQQIISIENQSTDMTWNIEKFNTQSAMITSQLTWAAENLIFAYHTLSAQKLGLQGNLELVERQLHIARIQESFNMIGPAEIKAIELGLLELQSGKNMLSEQMENMKRELNMLLGQSHEIPLTIKPLTVDVTELLVEVNWENDRTTATLNNLTIRALEQDVHAKHEAIRRFAGESRVRAAKEWENAVLKLEDEKRRFLLSLTRQQEDLVAKHSSLSTERAKMELEGDKHAHVLLRHSLGLISDLQLLTETLAFSNQQRRLDEMEQEFFKSYRKYHWTINGLSL